MSQENSVTELWHGFLKNFRWLKHDKHQWPSSTFSLVKFVISILAGTPTRRGPARPRLLTLPSPSPLSDRKVPIIIQQITDVKLFAYPPKQHDHFSTHGINTTFHQIIQHHNVLHLEAVSNAEQPVHNDSYEDICPLLFHRHVSSRFREEIWMFL